VVCEEGGESGRLHSYADIQSGREEVNVGVAPKGRNPARGGQGEQTRRSPRSTLQAARLNAECGSSKRRATRYECEPTILKREGRHLKREGRHPLRANISETVRLSEIE
jgi:hypothetical protein